MEDDKYSPNTVCVEFPVHEPYFTKGKRDVSMWEQLEIAAQYQYYWADNSVSITVTFKPDEANQLKSALEKRSCSCPTLVSRYIDTSSMVTCCW